VSLDPSDERRLQDIVDAIANVRGFLPASGNPLTKKDEYSVSYGFVVIGEAVNGLSQDIRDATPGVPWSDIINLRHLLAHRYWKIDFDLIQEIIAKDLEPLDREARALLA
jgi:uncharacterized protein with HEPN domain